MPPRSPPAARVLQLVAAHPLRHQADDRLARGPNSVEPASFDAGEIARRLDDRHLHAEADAEIRHVALAREARRLDLAFRAALAEAAGHENAVHIFEIAAPDPRVSNTSLSIQSSLTFTLLAMPPCVSASFERLVGVLEARVFADDGDA